MTFQPLFFSIERFIEGMFLFSTMEGYLSRKSNFKRIIIADCPASVIHLNKSGAPKSNHNAMVYAAKRNDYERVKILFKYGYRLEQKDNITDPLKKIELFKVSLFHLTTSVVRPSIHLYLIKTSKHPSFLTIN